MRIKFCGAARFVTGSAHLVTLDNGFTILLDCGLFQGKGRKIWDWNNEWLFNPADVDCLVLSHAHIDHCGRIPKLVKDGFNGPIYSTHATRSLCSIMLMDSAKIQERDVSYYNEKLRKKRRRKHDFRVPLYETTDVHPAMQRYRSFSYNTWFSIHPDVQVLFRDSGHILGSASVTLKIKEHGREKILGFTGDIGRPDRPILRDPAEMPNADILICESTYGDRIHEGSPEQNDRLLSIIKKTCLEKKGKLLIPAFSVGRTQEIVYMLDKLEHEGKLPRIPVYVDSPLSVNATVIFGTHPECYDKNLQEYLLVDDDPFGFNSLHYIRDVEDSKSLNDSKQPCVIISSSGMMNAGRVKHHLFNMIENPANTVLIVGYCTPETPGGQLIAGVNEINLFHEVKQVKAEVIRMDSFSAHGDQEEMIEFLNDQYKTVRQMFLVHGEIESQTTFKKVLADKGYQNIAIPARGDLYTA